MIAETISDRKKFLAVPYAAWVEMLLFFGALVAGNYLFSDGSRWINQPLHPFWIIILLVAAQYGTIAGLYSCVLATGCLYLGNLPPQSIEETFFDYELRLLTLPALWCITAFVLGQIRAKRVDYRQMLERELIETRKQASVIAAAYEKLKAAKEYQELSVASQRSTTAALYRSFKYLESLNPAHILRDLDKIVITTLNPKKFSVYALGSNGFEAATSFGWDEKDHFLPRIPVGDPLYEEVAIKRRLVCIVNHQDEKILAGQGLMAAPLIDTESGHVFGLIKICELNFFEFNISTLDIFKTLCELIGMAYANAKRYKRAVQHTLEGQTAGIPSNALYLRQKPLFEMLAMSSKKPLTQIVFSARTEGHSEEQQREVIEVLKQLAKPPIQIFEASTERLHFILLLPEMSVKQAESLSLQIVESLQARPALLGFACNQKVEAVYTPQENRPKVDEPSRT